MGVIRPWFANNRYSANMTSLQRKNQIFEELLFYIAKEKRLNLEPIMPSTNKELLRVKGIIEDLFNEHESIKINYNV
jgi:hypothetical protein